MIKPKKIIIVGGNAAGAAAAAKAKRVNPEAEIILFEAGNYISTGTCEIPYVISGEINSYKDIVYYDAESFYESKGVKVFVNHRVEAINRREKSISVKNSLSGESSVYEYDSLVLATGSRAKTIPGLNGSSKNISTLKNIDDLKYVEEYFATNQVKRVAIFGSGYIGLEAAESFKSKGAEVIIIEKEELPMASAELEVRHLILELLKRKQVEFYGNIKEPRLNFIGEQLKSITIDSRILELDLIIIAAGFESDNTLAIQSKLETGKFGGIKIDRKLKTSDSNIFAAGDNIEVINLVTRQPEYMPLATIAHEFGHIAGENAAGGNAFTEPVVKNIGVKIFDKYLVTVGITSIEASKLSIPFNSVEKVSPNLVKVMPQSQSIFGKINYDKNTKRILGGTFLGGKEVSGYGDIISLMIKTKIPANELAKVNYNYSPPLSPFINLLSLLGREIK